MRFVTQLPGLNRYRPIMQPWEPTMTAPRFQTVARVAEEAGFDAVAVPEHIVVPRDDADAMGAHWPDAFTTMAFVAGATSRIRVNSCVLVLPYHHPMVLAKAVSTLDVLSGGRVTVTVGVGHTEGEFAALGVPFHERGRIADEYLAVLHELWTSSEPRFEGRYVSFHDVILEPRPVQTPHPPVWIGGDSPAARRRVARFGDGWWPWQTRPADIPARLDEIRALPSFGERPRPLDVFVSVAGVRVGLDHRPLPGARDGAPDVPPSRDAIVDTVGHLAELGVTWTMVAPPASRSLEEHLDHLRWMGAEVLPACR